MWRTEFRFTETIKKPGTAVNTTPSSPMLKSEQGQAKDIWASIWARHMQWWTRVLVPNKMDIQKQKPSSGLWICAVAWKCPHIHGHTPNTGVYTHTDIHRVNLKIVFWNLGIIISFVFYIQWLWILHKAYLFWFWQVSVILDYIKIYIKMIVLVNL